jgi:hypothetical protein
MFFGGKTRVHGSFKGFFFKKKKKKKKKLMG